MKVENHQYLVLMLCSHELLLQSYGGITGKKGQMGLVNFPNFEV